jgi:hypothetical protein
MTRRAGNPAQAPTLLSPKLNKRLMSYVAAAGAAGAGMLAGSQLAEAEVVYTPANTPLLINTPVGLDLNGDGTVDFNLSNNYFAGIAKSCTICSFFAHASLKVNPAQAGNAIWAITSASHHSSPGFKKNKKPKNRTGVVAVPVPWGVVVGPERNLQADAVVMDSANFMYSYSDHFSYNSIGAWGKGRRFAGSYLGLKFTVGGEVHYGWARVTVHADHTTMTATLTGYAYETIANRGIITGFTKGTLDDAGEKDSAAMQNAPAPGSSATLGRLAQGAAGVPAWRVNHSGAPIAVPAPGE